MKRKSQTTNRTIDSAAELARELGGGGIGKLGEYQAYCPAHNDKNKSLTISKGYKHDVILHCHAGCSFEEIMDALFDKGISINNNVALKKGSGLPKGIAPSWDGKRYLVHWTYNNEAGEPIGHVVRYESGAGEKVTIPYFKRDDDQWRAGYSTSLKENRPLYNLDKLDNTGDEAEVWVVEGEKCADTLTELGLIATTSPGGANSPKKTDWELLSDKKIIIWPDKDQAGKVYAANVLEQLFQTGDSDPQIEIVDVDQLDLEEKEDAFDWFEKGYGKKDILNIPTQPAKDIGDLGIIVVDSGEIWRAVDEAEIQLLKKIPYTIFQRAGTMVRIRDQVSKNIIDGTDEKTSGIVLVNAPYLTSIFNRELTFVQWTKEGYKAIDPPAKVANRYLARSGHWKLKSLSGLIYAPTLKPDGSVLERPGYDESTGLYYINTGTKFRPIKKAPDFEDARRALQKLRKPFQEFPFEKPEDESVVLAAVLTGLVRKSVPFAPIFGFTAPTAGSGKTLLTHAISIIVIGEQAPVTAHDRDKEEERKHLFATLLQGKPIMIIDNVEKPIGSEMINLIVTSSKFEGRILGVSENKEVATDITMMITGNNLSFTGDLTRRVLLCKIDTGMENPEQRKFKRGNLKNYVYQQRSRLVNAGLTILKAYKLAGSPPQDIPQYGSFEQWSDWVRSALVWLGMEDPYLTRKRVEMEDQSKIILSTVMNLWWAIHKDDPITVAEIVKDCNKAMQSKNEYNEDYELAQALLSATWSQGKQLNSRKVAGWLNRNKDKIHNDMKFIQSDKPTGSNAVAWQLIKFS